MNINKIKIVLFRNHKNFEIDVKDNFLWIIGENGKGKTNILESIYFFLNGKSQRTSDSSICIPWKSELKGISGSLSFEVLGKLHEIKSTFFIDQNNQKSHKILLDNIPKKAFQIRKLFPSLYFCPEDIEIFSGSPGSKRNFLDEIFEILNPNYKKTLDEFNAILKRRNALLKDHEHFNLSHLEIWDEKIYPIIIDLNSLRRDMTNQINHLINTKLPKDLLDKFEFYLEFTPSFEGSLDEWKERAKKDNLAKITTKGSHRDTFCIKTSNNIDIKDFASRGERRLLHLSILLSGVDLIKNEYGFQPVLLIDDVLSELDERHSKSVIKLLENYKYVATALPNIKSFIDLKTSLVNIL